MVGLQKIIRKSTLEVKVGNILIGGKNPIVVQSMTNTPTQNIKATITQIIELHNAGSEIVRVTVNDIEAARAIPKIINELDRKNLNIPVVGCFHYNGHTLLSEILDCAKLLAKYRINPGNVGFKNKRDKNFEKIIELAIKNKKPIRIGVNWGSLDQYLLADLMDKNAKLNLPKSADYIMRKAIIESALQSAKKAEEIGLDSNKIILSAKLSKVQDLISVYRELSKKCNYPLHLGLTEAGIGIKGVTATTAALSTLLQEGIGDTIRASLTPKVGESRTTEVKLCQEILQSLEIRDFAPQISACPGCGRTSSTYFQQLAQDIQKYIDENMIYWKNKYKNVESLKIAVMGCIVNGPGESKHADIGISLPGDGENPVAVVYTDSKKTNTLRGNNITQEFIKLVDNYITQKFTNK
ncbi:flavodoxin-dependent (E)-4-hydroxy-3-methylbut-2-enyl-diphosphate synthase [Rickettsiales endosymbiont of Trichoplax sp. H2]|uniref:flavodoxin-dependent (E)-4-hydroxy-3-methylbut-2-enyl-diphosphate synthase n=1 Tax=Rickettsiales endosymbiont of Trichoplax sp. H2 TaxID=2021221 RepID=UPI0012B40EFD|nr:flavodoxin-dependent (E)-4-hydroxy-3-methylbut-2-enyl-diphosphate synthase [Rickettsiales endosymbiont of Trichoplax sp. H2]MSO14161.1 4-hydroxy-3-methylbut-2-en-1-yl diphosphate synthase (flavodoxin) [Rickettsiales endosymbiont of Trichoplax sp. H2]